MTQQDRSRPIQPDEMARPPDELVCVVLALRPEDALDFWEWVVQAHYDVEEYVKLEPEWDSEDTPERAATYGFLENLALCNQACTSAATSAFIYRPTDASEYHFITLEPASALTVIHLMAQSQARPDIQQMYTVISNQVDRAFLERNEFANIPDDGD